MHRTAVRDFQEFGPLLLDKLSLEDDLALDVVEHPLLRLTFSAIFRVDSRVAQAHRHADERPPVPSRIQRDGHRHSRAETREHEVVGVGPGVGSASADRLIRDEMMAASRDVLRKPGGIAADNDYAFVDRFRYDRTSLLLFIRLRVFVFEYDHAARRGEAKWRAGGGARRRRGHRQERAGRRFLACRGDYPAHDRHILKPQASTSIDYTE